MTTLASKISDLASRIGAECKSIREMIAGQSVVVAVTVPFQPTAGMVLLQLPSPRTLTFPAGGTGSTARAWGGRADAISFLIKKDGVEVGQISFPASATTGSFSVSSEVTFAPGDVIEIVTGPSSSAETTGASFALRLNA